MASLYATFELISEWSGIGLLLALLIAVHRFRVINSTVISVGITFIVYSLMEFINKPLLAIESREVWYGTWVIIDVFTVHSLYKAHDTLKVNIAKITNRVAFTFCFSAVIHTLRYIDRKYFAGEHLETLYPVAINTINISLAVMALTTVIKDKKEKLVGLYV